MTMEEGNRPQSPGADAHSMALFAAFSCLVSELNKRKSIDFGALIENIQGTGADLRRRGHSDIAASLHRLSEHQMTTVRDK